jgi:hypothetical protein
MASSNKNFSSRLKGRARFEGAPAAVTVRLFRPSVARLAVATPIRLRLQTHAALGLTRTISISR